MKPNTSALRKAVKNQELFLLAEQRREQLRACRKTASQVLSTEFLTGSMYIKFNIMT